MVQILLKYKTVLVVW